MHLVLLSICVAAGLFAQDDVDRVVKEVLAQTGVPGASVAIVRGGKISYVKAYGDARLSPRVAAAAGMRYKIASNSKQFASSAILLLAEEGKLTLDDKVSRWLPELTRAGEVTVRQLLSHTSGYQDYYAIDFLTPLLAKPVTPAGILDAWAKKPLDFEPGTRYQYSNTNYTIVALIIEKTSGQKLMDFYRERFFRPLGMRSPVDVDHEPWSNADPLGYVQYALGPQRAVASEGSGWMWGAGGLAMTAEDLARWNVALMNGAVLKAASMKALTTEVRLKDGTATGYALGLVVSNAEGHRKWSHGGGASGFDSMNATWPDDKVALTVLTNGETRAHQMIMQRVGDLLAPSWLEIARGIFRDLQEGKVDRSLLTEEASGYFSAQAVADFAGSLKPLGAATAFKQTSSVERGGMTHRVYGITAGGKPLRLSSYWTPAGKVMQYLISLVQGEN